MHTHRNFFFFCICTWRASLFFLYETFSMFDFPFLVLLLSPRIPVRLPQIRTADITLRFMADLKKNYWRVHWRTLKILFSNSNFLCGSKKDPLFKFLFFNLSLLRSFRNATSHLLWQGSTFYNKYSYADKYFLWMLFPSFTFETLLKWLLTNTHTHTHTHAKN